MNSEKQVQAPKEFTVVVEKLVSRGEGLARHHGKVVLIPFVLPGEKVHVRVTQSKKEYDRALPVEVIAPSIHRTVPECSLFEQCGGCQWQHITYSEQLNQKQLLVQEAFLRMGKLEVELPEIVSGLSFGYRNRVQIQENAQGIRGFMARKTEEVISVSECPVLYPTLQSVFHNTGTKKGDTSIKKNQKIHGFGWKDSVVTYAPMATQKGGRSSRGPRKKISQPSSEVKVDLLGKKISFDLKCFFQSNLELLPEMIQYVLKDYSGPTALDLYCGVGLFGAFLADKFDRVIAIEENKRSMVYAKQNIPENQQASNELKPIFISQPVEKVSTTLPKIDLAVVDPPRPGLTKQAKEFLLKQNIPQLVYVSCDPVTLARDTKELLANGYRIDDMKVFDFYPQTFHIESVVHLSRELS